MERSRYRWRAHYDRIIRLIQKQISEKIKIPFELRVWSNRSYLFGKGKPAFVVSIKDKKGLSAIGQMDELKICEQYMEGSIDIDGEMFHVLSLRDSLKDVHPLFYLWRRILPLLIGEIPTNKKAISSHYEFANEFYLSFMDRTRCYSHALYLCDQETLEEAQKRKLDFAIESCMLKAGDRVLDVGGGWGTFTEYAGLKGIKVTSLTIADQSEKYLTDLIREKDLPCNVEKVDFLKYKNEEPFDAIVILGVMEHLPNYRAVLKQFERLLKPGGHVYLDASAIREKYGHPSFIARYIFPGAHSCLCLHDFLREVAKSKMDLKAVYNDRHSYYLTSKAWAQKLEASKEKIIGEWGDALYRRFRLYLWGTAFAFEKRSLDAYRVVLELPSE